MTTKSVSKRVEQIPSLFDDFFKPWSEWFGNGGEWKRSLTVPAVNITEGKDEYKISLAAPGLKKHDFKINVEGNMLTISSEKEENREEKDESYSRKEYNYSSFSRSFNIPEGVNQDKIDARYDDGVLKLILPKKEEAKRISVSRNIDVK